MSSDIVLFETKDLAVSDDVRAKYESLAAQMSGQRDGFEDGGGDWKPAVVKIVQPVTQDPAKPSTAKNGDLFTKGGMVKKPLRGVVAYAWYSRVRFVQGDGRPSCSSENVDVRGRGKDDKSVSVFGDACNKCPMGDQPFSTGRQTNCNNVLNVLMIPETLDGVYHLQFSKSSFNVGRQLTDLARATPQAWSRFYDVNTESKKRDKGQGVFFVPTVTPVADAEVPEHLKAFAQFVSNKMKEMRETAKKEIRQRNNDVAANLDTLETIGGTVSAERGFKDTI